LENFENLPAMEDEVPDESLVAIIYCACIYPSRNGDVDNFNSNLFSVVVFATPSSNTDSPHDIVYEYDDGTPAEVKVTPSKKQTASSSKVPRPSGKSSGSGSGKQKHCG
jgi:hypothetical protein